MDNFRKSKANTCGAFLSGCGRGFWWYHEFFRQVLGILLRQGSECRFLIY